MAPRQSAATVAAADNPVVAASVNARTVSTESPGWVNQVLNESMKAFANFEPGTSGITGAKA